MSSSAHIAMAVKEYLVGAGVLGLSSRKGDVQGVRGFAIRCHARIGGGGSGTLRRLIEAEAPGKAPIVVHPAGAVDAEDLSVTMRLEDFAPMFVYWLEAHGSDIDERRRRGLAQRQRRRRTD